eukprot:3705637-Pleurochrysis_carterae.AAC.1
MAGGNEAASVHRLSPAHFRCYAFRAHHRVCTVEVYFNVTLMHELRFYNAGAFEVLVSLRADSNAKSAPRYSFDVQFAAAPYLAFLDLVLRRLPTPCLFVYPTYLTRPAPSKLPTYPAPFSS